MHEMSITMSMMDIVQARMERDNVKRLKRLRLKVGEETAVEPHALLFCFDVCTKGTSMEGAVLDIEEIPMMGRCIDCNKEFHMVGFLVPCPKCDSGAIKKISGDELDIVSMEVE